jgi:hypothetical protein
MKKLMFVVISASFLLFASDLRACEKCFGAGSTDPVGNYLTSGQCWSGYDAGYGSCVPNATSCTTTVDSTCTGGSGAGGGPKNKDLSVSMPKTECSVDAVGVCSASPHQRSPFLQ